MIRILAVLLLVAGVLLACRPSTATDPPPEDLVECRPPLQPPARFRSLETFREPGRDHVGIRAGFVDDRGRELHVFAGIPGEYGEGLPAAGEVELPHGPVGLVSGGDRVWVIEWTQGGPCDPRAVLVSGFARRGFLALLQEMEVTADRT